MALDRRVSLVGIAKQSVKGTSIATPLFGLGVKPGTVLIPQIEQGRDPTTATQPVSVNTVRDAVSWAQRFSNRLLPRSLGMYLIGVLGGVSTSGTTPNFTHTITPSLVVPRYTFHGRLDSEYALVKDGRVSAVEITWEDAKSPMVAIEMAGCVLAYGTSWAATNDETTQTNILPSAGGTFKVDAGSATAVVADISGGKIRFSRDPKGVALSKQIEWDDVVPGELVMDVELRLRPADLSEWREAVTGTAAGTTTQATPQIGSFDVLFAKDANTSLQIAATRVPFLCDFPDSDPDGGPVEIALVGQILKPAGAAVTATLKNDFDGTGY